MTIKELLDKLSEICNEKTKDFPIVINGTFNWEYIDTIRVNECELIIESTDLRSK